MSTPRSEYTQRLAALRERFDRELPDRLQALQQSLLLATDSLDAMALALLGKQAHMLAGTAASFGYAELAQVLALVEGLALDVTGVQDAPRIAQLRQLAPRLVFAGTPTAEPQPLPSAPRTVVENPLDGQRLLVIEDETSYAEELRLQLEYFGYRVDLHHDGDTLETALRAAPYDAVVLDMRLGADKRTSAEIVTAMTKEPLLPPIVFMSYYSDFFTRLAAVRAGGRSYLAKPVDVPALVDTIEQITGRAAVEALRVMIVDDSPSLSELHAAQLQAAGMATRVINDPFAVAGALQEFFPDLVLLDINMPDCDGMELAAVIRQQVEYLSLPIVFCSTEARIQPLLPQILATGDDYLVKPLQADLLVAKVAGLAGRYRALRSMMTRDSLTQCLNHTRIKEAVSLELERARRESGAFSVAMLDIDHFKDINDNFGHPVGDRVIKNLAHLLRQRLRKSDLIGRYGGEEFLVVLPGTEPAAAAQLMEQMRVSFGLLRHLDGDHELHATFSCGIAGYPQSAQHAEALIELADNGVYDAKRGGRNRIVCC